MLRTRVIPCLLLSDGGLVKTVRFKDPSYVGDPVNVVKIFNEKEVDELVFLDISATKDNREPPLSILSEIADECFMPLAYGGGIKNIETIKRILGLGIEKVVICSEAAKNPDLVGEAARLFGSQSIVVSVDARRNDSGNYEVFAFGGAKPLKMDPAGYASKMEQMGAGEIFLNSIDRDGMMNGYDLDLVKKVSAAINVPLIACGGAGKIDDIGKAVRAGASAAAAGSIFIYQGLNKSVLINFPSQKELRAVLA